MQEAVRREEMDRACLLNLRAYFPESSSITLFDEKVPNVRTAAAPELGRLLKCGKCHIYSSLGASKCGRCNGPMP
eukprot:9586435-Alexandrium_andersonii.AAC.1